MWSKRLKSAASLILAGSIIATVPVISAGAAVTANAVSVVSVSASQNDWYYNVISSAAIPDGEYIFYNADRQAVMTGTLETSNHSFPSYKSDALSCSVPASEIPSDYLYTIKSAGNGKYYIMKNGQYLNIVRYGNLEFTSTPSPLELDIYNDGAITSVIVKKFVSDKYYAISMYSTEWFTVHDYGAHSSSQTITLLKYENKQLADTSKKLSEYNIQNYDKSREFTPKKVGDIAGCSTKEIKMGLGLSNRIATGIWGTPGEKIKIYVQANANEPTPSIVLTQHISQPGEYTTIPLRPGINEITVPQLHENFSDYTTKTEPGGCMYIINPYTSQQQTSDVKLYIEGGDKIPIFRQGDNVRDFVTQLREYYNNYQQGKNGYHNAAEFTSKHTIFTLTLTRMYDGYITKAIDPQAVADSWDSYMENLWEFGGLTSAQYKNFVLHIKINQPYGGAYATVGHVGIQDKDMSAAALTTSRRGWGYSHEIGHILDLYERAYGEVTNNMWAMSYGLSNETIYDIAIIKRPQEMVPLMQNEINSIWNSNEVDFWTLSMFWDLEVYHNGYWKELNNIFTKGTCGDATVDNYARNLGKEEKIALYSSKIMGIDLTYYFKRYGFIKDTSAVYSSAISALPLKRIQPKFWYYDDEAYNKPLNTNIGKADADIEVTPDKGFGSVFFNIPEVYKDAHLGLEIIRDGKVVDFIYGSRYISDNISGDYTVNAYDRALNVYKTMTFNVSLYPKQFVAWSGNSYYGSLKEAVDAAPDGGTVYVTNSTVIKEQIVIDGKTVTIMPYDTSKQIVIHNDVTSDVFVVKNNGALCIKTGTDKDNMLVFEGADKNSQTLFRLYNFGKLFLEKGVTVRHFHNTNYGGSVVYGESGSEAILSGPIIEYNYATAGTVYLTGGSILDSTSGTIFRENRARDTGSVIYTATQNDQLYIEDTLICKNFCNTQETGATIYMNAGFAYFGEGTSINNNVSDWYNLNSAMYICKGAKVHFIGNIDIGDMVTTNDTVVIDPQLSGILNIRTAPAFTNAGNNLAVPTNGEQGSFPKSITSVVKYNHNEYSLVNDIHSLYIANILPLENKSTVSATSVNLGKSVTIKASATGGDGNYTYGFYYKKSTDTKWTTKQDFKTNATVSFTPDDEGKYNICVKVKDGFGNVEKKYFDITVKKVALALNASVSSTSILLGNTFTAKASATGGMGGYTYAFYYKQKSQTKWTTKQDFKTTNSVSIKPAKATDYDVCVKVKDKSGTVLKKYFTVKVTTPLSSSVTIPSTAKLGNTIPVKVTASGGTAPYKYAFYYKKTTDTKWVTKQDFKDTNSAAIKPSKAAEYEICVKVKDSTGTVSKKYFYVTVSK